MRRRRFVLPHPDRSHPGWGIASVAVHAVFIVLVLTAVGRSVATRSDVQFIQLPALRTAARQHDLPAATSPAVPAATPVVTEQVASADTGAGPIIVITPRVVPMSLPPKNFIDYNPIIGSVPSTGAKYGDGRVWVDASELRLGIRAPVGPRFSPMDSVALGRIREAIAALPPDSFATPGAQSWTVESDGKTWGIDGKWIYLGPIKIPAAILALLPVPEAGNYYQAKEEADLQRIREQIMFSAQLAETKADIRKYIKEIRRRRDLEREERKKREAQVAALQEAAKRAASRDTIPKEY